MTNIEAVKIGAPKEGDIYGKWRVLCKVKSKDNKNTYFKCFCMNCGSENVVVGYSLKNGTSKSCCGKQKGSKEKRLKIRTLLLKGWTQRDILSQIYTSPRMIVQERKKLKTDKIAVLHD